MRAICVILALCTVAYAETILTVCSAGCQFQSVQSAIDAAPPGSVIELKAGEVFAENLTIVGKSNLRMRTSRWRELPSTGYRIDPVTHAGLLATVRSGNSEPALSIGANENAVSRNGVDIAADTLTFDGNTGPSVFSNGSAIGCIAFAQNQGSMPAPLVYGRKYWIRDWNAGLKKARLSETPAGPAIDLTATGSASSERYYGRPLCVLWDQSKQITVQGIRFDNRPGVRTFALVQVGHNMEADRKEMGPSEVEFLHTVISGVQDDSTGPRLGLSLSGYKILFRDSWIGHIKQTGEESKAIAIGNVSGASILNNYISAASINLLTAGSDSAAMDVNRDLVITGNFFEKPGYMMYKEGAGAPTGECYHGGGSGAFYRRTDVTPNTCANGACYSCGTDNRWRADPGAFYRNDNYLTKNMLELKDCEDCLIEGNYLKGGYGGPDVGQGWCLGISVITSQPGFGGGGSGYHRAHNVTFRNNWADSCYSGVFMTHSSYGGVFDQIPMKNIVFENNLLSNMGWYPAMTQFTDSESVLRFGLKQTTGISGFRFVNNTLRARSDYNMGVVLIPGSFGDRRMLDYQFENNLINGQRYPFFLDSMNNSCAPDGLFQWIPNDGQRHFRNNVFVGGASTTFLSQPNCSVVTENLLFESSDVNVGFRSATDHRLSPASRYSAANLTTAPKSTGSGADLGADIDMIEQYALAAQKGEPSSPEQLGVSVVTGSHTALLRFTRPENTSCQVSLYAGARLPGAEYSDTNTVATRQADRLSSIASGRTIAFLAGAYTALTPATRYQYRIDCGAKWAVGKFQTNAVPVVSDAALSVDSTSLHFTYTYGAGPLSPTTKGFTVTNSSGVSNFIVQTSLNNWLSATTTFGTTPGTVTVQVNPALLLPGVYLGSVAVEVPGKKPVLVAVDVVVMGSANAPTSGTGTRFIPVPPCRVSDTRLANGALGGPALPAGGRRDFPIPLSACNIPATAAAYWLNVTVVPSTNSLSYLTLWPTGGPQPLVSTLNAFDGSVTSNAAIVPAGTGGSISAFVTDRTEVILDVNGYFSSAPSPQALVMYPVAPCRVADTRLPPALFGGPSMAASTTRDFPILSSACGIPAGAMAYSLNVTVVPFGPLAYLTTYGTGQTRPAVSTLNSFDGRVKANATVVAAGVNGGISMFATDKTDVIVDLNAYFAPPGGGGGLQFYPTAPYRVIDTRLLSSTPLTAGSTLDVPIAAAPSNAVAYSTNITAVPTGSLGYLTAWPSGGPKPAVSTLNSPQGKILGNAAIVAAGTTKAMAVFITNPAHFIIDMNGYFAP